jgi:hypothetical protein
MTPLSPGALGDQFETSWDGDATLFQNIDDFLDQPGLPPVDSPGGQALLRELVERDLDLRLQARQAISAAQYLRQYPMLAAEAAFAQRLEAVEQERNATAPPTVPGYEMGPELGRGGWAIVYRAQNTLLENRTEAIKLVDPQLNRADPRVQVKSERLQKEIAVAAQLKHANIVHLYTAGEQNGIPYFAMEYCPGGSLAQRLANRPLRPDAAAALVETLALAIADVHEFAAHHRDVGPASGLIHRDLKPSNVLFGERDVPKIADFGFAQWVREGLDPQAVRELAGTPAYMAPEQIDPARGVVGKATDVYGLGAILYECLTGRPPFTGPEVSAVFGRVLDEAPTSPRQRNRRVPADLEAVCLKCLAKDPRQRYGTARELAADLARFRAGIPVLARRQPVLRIVWHWVRSNPIKSAVVCLVILAALAYNKIRSDANEHALQLANARQERAEQLAEAEGLRAIAEADARRQAEERAHAARVAAARQLASRGNWVAGLPAYDRVIAAGEADALRLRVERLVGYFALNETAKLTAELEALGRLDLGDLAARVNLLHGSWLLCDSAEEKPGRALVRKALAERQRLSPADAAFAEALVADRLGQAIAALRQALKEDPLHYLAASSLPVALAAAGQRDEARRAAAFLRGVFPYSPTPDLVDGLAAFLEADRAGVKRALVKVAGKLPPDRRPALARMEQFLLLLVDIQDINTRVSANGGFDPGGETRRAEKLLVKAMQAGGVPNREPLALPVPAVSLMFRRYLELFSAYQAAALAQKGGAVPDGLLGRLEALNADAPDAFALLLTATVRLHRALGPVNQGDADKARAELGAAAELCAQATRAPCILPRSAIPYMARAMGMVADVGVLKLIRDPDGAHLRRLREGLHLLVAEGAKWKGQRLVFISGYVAMTTAPLVPAQCRDWKLEQPAGKEAFAKRKQALATLAQSLLDDWAIDEPKNPSIPRLREAVRAWQTSSGILEDPKGPLPKK